MSTTLNRRHAGRRGALLLLVLTALTFFMMIGTLMLILATRTRTASRAFADAATATATTSLQARGVLDDALMVLLRGKRSTDEAALPARTTTGGPGLVMRGQSLLEDKYGTSSITGTASAPTRMTAGALANYAPVLTTNLSQLTPPPAHPCDLNGRLLTFTPDPGDGDVATFRILRTTAQGQTITAYLANHTPNRATTLPKTPSAVVINGREFCQDVATENNEGYDAFGTDATGRVIDAWLAGSPLQQSRPVTSGTIRCSFVGPSAIGDLTRDANGDGLADGCDNDNDGVADSWWISGLVADRPSPLGGVLKHDVAFLVLDLDGRINVNAAGSLTPVTTTPADWPATIVTSTIDGVSAGMGYGPADVGAGRLVATGTNPAGVPGFPGRWPQICQTTTSAVPVQTAPAPATQRRPTPFLGASIEGRYGPSGTTGRWSPGRSGGSLDTQTACGLVGNSPTDLSARMKVFHGPASSGVPTLYFYTPDYTASDLTESPYQLRLDADGPRTLRIRQATRKAGPNTAAAAANRATDNVFAVGELERILRQFDPDAGTLPSRLAALLDDFTERSRMTVTTDSWDTPAMAGAAMLKLRDFLRRYPVPTTPAASLANGAGAEVYDTLSPDVSAGLRFDINRPLDHPTAFNGMPAAQAAGLRRKIKERYCRHLYTLLVALGLPASRDTAQWAANVCDFRDPDSAMTRFRYDPDPTNGWSKSGLPTVFGAERPEVVITETVAWHDGATGGLSVVLYHPWEAKIIDKQSQGNAGRFLPTEAIDASLASTTDASALDLARKIGDDPIWRLRVIGGTTIDFSALGAAGDAGSLVLRPNSYVCMASTAAGGSLTSITVNSLQPTGPGIGKVALERLADPSRPHESDDTSDGYNPYITVDEAALVVADDPTKVKKQQRNQAAFWKQAWTDAAGPPAAYPAKAPWFHWPNRPFVGVAELALVPAGDANGMLQVGNAAASPALDAADPAKRLIVDAVHVPSRFAGTSRRIGGDALLQAAMSAEEVCTTMLPTWREPGRVNVNTIASNTGNGQSQLDNGVWTALLGPAAQAVNNGKNPFEPGGAAAADSFSKMVSLAAAGGGPFTETPTPPRDSNPFFTQATAIRLGNAGTIRSNVFAIWITLRITDTSASAPSPTYKRLFAIVDRSIPVGFRKGENLNARETVRLQRFLD